MCLNFQHTVTSASSHQSVTHTPLILNRSYAIWAFFYKHNSKLLCALWCSVNCRCFITFSCHSLEWPLRSEYSTKYYRMFSNVEFPDISRDEWSFQTALFFEMGVTSQSRLLTLSIYYLQSLFTTSFALKFDVWICSLPIPVLFILFWLYPLVESCIISLSFINLFPFL